MQIVVLSTFDVWPPQDGGQTRYVNLWSNFSASCDIKLIVYEFRNLERDRRYRIAPNLEVLVPRASDGDARHFHHMMEATSLWLQDALCLSDYEFSESFLRTLKTEAARCDVIVASHPYLARVAFPLVKRSTLKIYESFNVEADIKKKYFAQGTNSLLLRDLLFQVEAAECMACEEADHVTAVSREDKDRFQELYETPMGKISVVPNGCTVSQASILDLAERKRMRATCIEGDVEIGVFLGSAFAPNVNSYRAARLILQDSGFRGTMMIMGSIAAADRSGWPSVDFEERWLGFVDEETKMAILSIASFALQMIFDGAGTNLKVFDYMAAGVPIVANAFGRRGVDHDGWSWPVETAADMRDALNEIAACGIEVEKRAAKAFDIVSSEFDWRSIARRFETRIADGFSREL